MIKKIVSFAGWVEKSEVRYLAILFIVGLALKIALIFYWNSEAQFETFEHGMIAENIASGNGFSMYWPYTPENEARKLLYESPPEVESAFIPPLNPFLLSVFYKSFGINNTANIIYLVFLAFFSAFTPVVVYFTTKLLTNQRAAVFASLLYFFFLPAIYSTVTFSGGVIYHLLAIAIIYYFAKIYKNPNQKYYIIVGMLLGLQTLTRSEFLLLGIIMLGMSYMINRGRKFEFKSTLLSLIIFCAIVTPWVVRNTNLFGKLVPIVSHPWHEIWRGSNEYATGGAFAKGEIHNWMGKKRYPEIHSALESLEYDQRFEIRADSVYKYHAVQYWKAEPLNSVYLAIKRVLILWSFDPFTPSSMRIIYLIPSCLVSILFFLSLFVLKRQSKLKAKIFYIFYSFVIYYTLLIGFVNFEVRYQVYLHSTVIIFVGLAIDFIISNSEKKISNK